MREDLCFLCACVSVHQKEKIKVAATGGFRYVCFMNALDVKVCFSATLLEFEMLLIEKK